MAARDLRREIALRRILEGVIATVTGGLILWSVTSSMSQPAPVVQATAAAVAPAAEAEAAPEVPKSSAPAAPATRERRAGPVAARVTAPDLIPAPAAATPVPRRIAVPRMAAVGSSLLYEDFSSYREGDAPGWGPATFVKTGLDHRHWLVSNVDGSHPVGCRIRLPEVFSFECRYSACLPEVNRGILGWWKEPVSTTILFPDDRGGRCVFEWVIKYGNDPTEFNPVGSSSLFARKYYHTITLPDGSSNEVGVVQPTGLLRIDVKNSAVTVFIDGQAVVAGSIARAGQFVGFEANLVKGRNGMLCFTDFKINR
jgi:hypothetical protein